MVKKADQEVERKAGPRSLSHRLKCWKNKRLQKGDLHTFAQLDISNVTFKVRCSVDLAAPNKRWSMWTAMLPWLCDVLEVKMLGCVGMNYLDGRSWHEFRGLFKVNQIDSGGLRLVYFSSPHALYTEPTCNCPRVSTNSLFPGRRLGKNGKREDCGDIPFFIVFLNSKISKSPKCNEWK